RMMLGKSKSDKITTTLDAGLQRRLEELAQNWKGRLPPRSSLAMIVVDHTDMRVRGWVGSVDLNDDSRFGHVDMVNSIRSPGSVLKPFVYGLALDEGDRKSTRLNSSHVSISYAVFCSKKKNH